MMGVWLRLVCFVAVAALATTTHTVVAAAEASPPPSPPDDDATISVDATSAPTTPQTTTTTTKSAPPSATYTPPPPLLLAERRLAGWVHSFEASKPTSDETTSGYLSELGNTASARALLIRIIKQYQITSIYDVGCGDFHWIADVLASDAAMKKIDYLGVDIVPHFAAANAAKAEAKGLLRAKFATADVAAPDYAMPRAFDLVVLRDLAQHQPLDDSMQIMRMVEKSESKYILATFHRGTRFNNGFKTFGGNFYVHMSLPPFNFAAKPLEMAQEHKKLKHPLNAKGLGLWTLPALREDEGEKEDTSEEGANGKKRMKKKVKKKIKRKRKSL
jgi:SAM-dependent methyltransferase